MFIMQNNGTTIIIIIVIIVLNYGNVLNTHTKDQLFD